MPDQTNPVTGYNPANPPSGKGGRTREDTIMSNVDNIAGGSSKNSTNGGDPHPAAVAAKPKPSGLVPMGDNGPHIYGSPISTPILSGGK